MDDMDDTGIDQRPLWDRLLAVAAPWPVQFVFVLAVIWLWMKLWAG